MMIWRALKAKDIIAALHAARKESDKAPAANQPPPAQAKPAL
jgi:hypothetical protein